MSGRGELTPCPGSDPEETPVKPAPHQPLAAITGGASGIGLSFARQWISDGGAVVLLDLSEPTLEHAVAELGPHARGIRVDVTQRGTVDAAFANIAAAEGRLDALVNSAGIARPTPSHEMSDDDFSLVLDIHVTGTMRSCRAAYPLLCQTPGAAIVNLASVAAHAGMPGRANYTAAKAGIAGLTRTLAVEWAEQDIRVNAVAPGYVRTPFTDNLIAEGKLRSEGIESRTPLGRFARPEEIADSIAFLASKRASYITGHVLMVDGGITIQGDWY